jgi:hypothetical protein
MIFFLPQPQGTNQTEIMSFRGGGRGGGFRGGGRGDRGGGRGGRGGGRGGRGSYDEGPPAEICGKLCFVKFFSFQ